MTDDSPIVFDPLDHFRQPLLNRNLGFPAQLATGFGRINHVGSVLARTFRPDLAGVGEAATHSLAYQTHDILHGNSGIRRKVIALPYPALLQHCELTSRDISNMN